MEDTTVMEMEETMIGSPNDSDSEIYEIEDLAPAKNIMWLPYLLKHLAIMLIGGVILSVPVIVIVCLGKIKYEDIFKDVDRNDENFGFIMTSRAFTWATGMLVITTFVSFLVSMLPIFVLFCIELAKQYLEFYIALTTTIKVVISMSIAFGMWCFSFPSSVTFSQGDKEKATVIIFKVMFSLLVITLIIAVERIMIQFIAIRFHRTAYKHRLDESYYASTVLDKLGKARRRMGSSTNIFKSNPNSRPLTPDRSSFNLVNVSKAPKEIIHTPSGTAYSFPKKYTKDPNAKKIYESINKKDFEGRYEEDVDLHSKAEARKLAAKIFSSLQNKRRFLIVEDFMPYFDTREDAIKAFEFFDKDGNGDISKREMRDQISFIYKERKDLTLALSDTSQAVGKLDKIFLVLFIIICAFACSTIFGKDIYASLLPFGTFFLGLSFIFGENAKQLFQSIIFLFVMHPYDSGDRIYIDKDNYVVLKVGLLGSKLAHTNGQITYIPHNILMTKIIYNIRRSPTQAEQIDFQISFDTPKEKILKLKERINQYLVDEEPREFFDDPLVALSEIVDSNKLNMFIWLEHKGNWQDGGRRWARKTRFMLALKEICQDLGLTYSLLPQKVQHENPPPAFSSLE
ncbi:hypothetical protein K502DRAFT_330497 [Neoconidiobolus thromboides FSU 785]|nr:hypothetical protein K502DRAFT_330497 [Neoconidiobolus thromboides FSU 785]